MNDTFLPNFVQEILQFSCNLFDSMYKFVKANLPFSLPHLFWLVRASYSEGWVRSTVWPILNCFLGSCPGITIALLSTGARVACWFFNMSITDLIIYFFKFIFFGLRFAIRRRSELPSKRFCKCADFGAYFHAYFG